MVPRPDYRLCIGKATRSSTHPYWFGGPMPTHMVPSARDMLTHIKTAPAGNQLAS